MCPLPKCLCFQVEIRNWLRSHDRWFRGDTIRAKLSSNCPNTFHKLGNDLSSARLVVSKRPWMASVVCEESSKSLNRIT